MSAASLRQDLTWVLQQYAGRIVLHHGIYLYERTPPESPPESPAREYYRLRSQRAEHDHRAVGWVRNPSDASWWHPGVVEALAHRGSLVDIWRDEDGGLLSARPWRYGE